jgi:tripartite-type tricarboxylate transporter receptor subunit TctC
MGMLGLLRAATAAIATTLAVSLGHAQSPAEFYRGRNVEIYVGYSVGGGYDIYARLLARHIGKHIPGNPTVVAKNMEGAASLRLANWLAKAAPKDGTVFGTIGRGTAFDPLLGQKGAQFTGTDFNWIGSANDEVSICVSWGTSDIVRFQDLLARELTIGGTGASDDTVQFAKVLNNVLGTRLKIVTGYPGGNDITLAMERREVDGRCGWSWTSVKANHPTWVAEKKIHVLVQLALAKHPDLPDVPLITDLATSAEQAQVLKLIFARQVMGRPFLAPPDAPKDRIAALRQAFMDTMNDKEFRADAERMRLEITPVSGDKLQALVQELYRTPDAVAQRAAAALN